MNFNFFSFLTVLISSAAFAQSGTLNVNKSDFKNSANSAKGVSVSVFTYKPAITNEYRGDKSTSNDLLDVAPSISLGYVDAPSAGIGWDANLAIANMKPANGDQQDSLLRASGNLSYSFNKALRIKGGLNLARFQREELSNLFKTAIGGQLGVTFQANSNIGFDLSYAASTMETEETFFGGEPFKLTLDGIELGVSATF